MDELVIGVARVNMLLRHAHSLKDKRQVGRSVIQKLRNAGFSVSEFAFADEPKRLSIGFAYAGRDTLTVENMVKDGLRVFEGMGDMLEASHETVTYSELTTEDEWEEAAEDDDPSHYR